MNFDSIQRPTSFPEIYTNYVKERGITDISEDLFERMILVYPGLLVTSSDGFVDLSEANFLIQCANYQNSADILAREFKFLYLNAGAWKGILSKLISDYVKLNNLTQDILIIMIQAASSSTGSVVKNILMAGQKPDLQITIDINSVPKLLDPEKQFLSDQERNTIYDIAEKLGLFSDTQIANYIKKLLFQ